MIDEQLASAIQVGIDNKESVEKTLGRPTFTGQFDPNDWYYVSRDTTPVRLPQPAGDRSDGAPRPVRPGGQCRLGRADRQGADRVRSTRASDKTPTLGRKRSFFEELFGNIGTISQPGLPGAKRSKQ